jgi:U6 snRNA-associated Sm-like protein LSm4
MVLPLSLIRNSQSSPLLVELKNGDSYSGILENSDSWMNMHLREGVWSSRDGEQFKQFKDVFIRGNNIKLVRLQEQIIEKVKEEVLKSASMIRNRVGRGRAVSKPFTAIHRK